MPKTKNGFRIDDGKIPYQPLPPKKKDEPKKRETKTSPKPNKK